MSMLFVLICTLLVQIDFAIGKCGVPTKPSHGQMLPDKQFYDHGDKVLVKCEEKYVLFSEEDGIQACDYDVWLGESPVCLENLAYHRNLTHFGSPGIGKAKPNGGIFVYDVVDASEQIFFDLLLKKHTRHAYLYFHGNFTVTDQHGTELPFIQRVFAFDTTINFYEYCPKAQSSDYYECISPDKRHFTGAKVQINLLNETIDVKNNSVQVNLQLENNGFVILDVADKDCGTPPVPFHGSVSTIAIKTEAVYSCAHGYTLHGESVQTCDVSKFPKISWLSKIPVCLPTPPKMQAISDVILTAPNIMVIAMVSTVVFCVVILVMAVIIWFKKKRKLQKQNLPTNETMVEVIRSTAVSCFNRTCVHNSATTPISTNTNSYWPVPFSPSATYLTVTEIPFSHSTPAQPIYESVNDSYDYIDVANIKLPTSQL